MSELLLLTEEGFDLKLIVAVVVFVVPTMTTILLLLNKNKCSDHD